VILALSVTDAARAAGIGRSTLWRLIAKNKGPKLIKLSGRTLIRTEALSVWLAAMESKTN
jgi:predicted DNA-binding transcriptional regulator AlpA